jgi:uncharacterized coiled-coil DUF342 family protein
MDELRKQVRRAQRRITMQRFVGVLGWCWFAALLLALMMVVVDKYHPLPIQSWIWFAGAVALGLLGAVIWTALSRGRMLEAAMEIDRRFALKERVSSALAMPPEDLQSEAGQAVSADALRRVKRIEVAEKFAVIPPRKLLLPLAPAFAALIVMLFFNPSLVDNSADAKPENLETKPQVKKASESVRKQLAERREQAKKEGLQEAENLFKKLEEGTKELATTPPDREKALGKLNDLARQLQDRRQQLGGADKVKEQLDQLKNIDRGPADKFAQDISKGDLKQAADDLKKLKDQLENGNLTDQQKANLAKQLEQMKDKLDKLAESHKAAQADLQKQADQMRKAGQVADAEKLEQQLRQLQQQAPQMQQLQNMADKLGQCAQCMKQGNAKDAAKALDDMQACMGNLQQQLDEMKMLDDAMQQLAQAKDQMVCPFCGGEGCDKCNGKPGMGLGKGKGDGERPEAKTKTSTYDSHVKQKVGPGTARVVDLVDGPNIKGNVESQIQEEFDSTRRGSTDPSTGRQRPKKLSQHAREYFDNLREGE